ncbi:MAG: LOG family protein [Gammaproteobacteria bacterium]|nr:MAG: LOG family protein [Gammaproteobacteria bacterium]
MNENIITQFINTVITPDPENNILSQDEIRRMRDSSEGGINELFKKCALAVLNSLEVTDDVRVVKSQLKHFDINVLQRDRGIKLEIINAPAQAFVDGEMIQGIKEHLFSVLRDIVYLDQALNHSPDFDFSGGLSTTNAIFNILRNAKAIRPGVEPDLVVCWGGHAISNAEYAYCKEVGYRLGLRGKNIITGCGPGAMKGPMKGALIGQSKQRIHLGRFIGITEPGIIAAESPNPIVNELMIMPDIEKRLEAFVRLGHGIIVFPGGVGTMEEILYLMGILLDDENKHMPFPVVFTGNKNSEAYFDKIDSFLHNTLGEEVCERYQIIIDDPIQVAKVMQAGLKEVTAYRKKMDDAFHFNWRLKIDDLFQKPFHPDHQNMSALNLSTNQEKYILAANLRKAFSGIVTGNVKENGIEAIEKYGPYKLTGDAKLCTEIDDLLQAFIKQHRMKLIHSDYRPCYEFY